MNEIATEKALLITFDVPGTPQGKARARTVRNKYSGAIRSYTPDTTVLYENLISN